MFQELNQKAAFVGVAGNVTTMATTFAGNEMRNDTSNATGNATSNATSDATSDLTIDGTGTAMLITAIDEYMAVLETTVRYAHGLRQSLAIYPFLLVVKLLEGVAAQPRLAVLTNTLILKCVELVHLLVLFIPVFYTFAFSGMVLFGGKLEEFVDPLRAANTVFRAMVGDFDWEVLREVDSYEGFVWLALALLVVNLLMVNLILASVLDGYSKIAQNSHSTLVGDILHFFSDLWEERHRRQVPLRFILKALKQSLDAHQDKLDSEKGSAGRNLLVGRDAKAVIGLRVRPVDAAAKVLGAGTIRTIGTSKLVCMVLYRDGEVLEHDIGHDLNFDLKVCDAEDCIPMPVRDGADPRSAWQLVRPERLMNLMQDKHRFLCRQVKDENDIKWKMSHRQAFEILQGAVCYYYTTHRPSVTMERCWAGQLVREVGAAAENVRVSTEERCRANNSEEMNRLRSYLSSFYTFAEASRKAKLADIRKLSNCIADLKQKRGPGEVPQRIRQRVADEVLPGSSATMHWKCTSEDDAFRTSPGSNRSLSPISSRGLRLGAIAVWAEALNQFDVCREPLADSLAPPSDSPRASVHVEGVTRSSLHAVPRQVLVPLAVSAWRRGHQELESLLQTSSDAESTDRKSVV